MRLRGGGFGILSLKGRAPFAVVSAAIKIKSDGDDGDPKSKRARDAIESAPTMLESIQQWAGDVLTRLGNHHNLEALSKMSMAEMLQPVCQQCAQNARDHLEAEMLQAWAATQHVGANGAIAAAPNREESTLTGHELRYAIYQRLGLLDHLLELGRFNSPNGSCLACNRPNITAAHFSNCGHSCKEKHGHLARLHHQAPGTAGVNSRIELQAPNAQRKIGLFCQGPQPGTRPASSAP